jgi:N12 class adenine-specific DNA methylase
MKTRFAAFQNVPEMLRSWHVFADVKSGEDLQLPRPKITPRPDGRRVPQTIVVPASEAVREYIASLGERAAPRRSRRSWCRPGRRGTPGPDDARPRRSRRLPAEV